MIDFSCNITNKFNDFVLIYLLKRKVAFALCIGITVTLSHLNDYPTVNGLHKFFCSKRLQPLHNLTICYAGA